jgi:hypothetical protein
MAMLAVKIVLSIVWLVGVFWLCKRIWNERLPGDPK